MTMASTLIESRPRSASAARWRSEALDAALLLICLSVAGLMFFDGGAEALGGAAAAAAIGARTGYGVSARRVFSAAFAGLFAGALFAGFFHNALTALVGQFF
jgi:hypothetical protein